MSITGIGSFLLGLLMAYACLFALSVELGRLLQHIPAAVRDTEAARSRRIVGLAVLSIAVVICGTAPAFLSWLRGAAATAPGWVLTLAGPGTLLLVAAVMMLMVFLIKQVFTRDSD